MKDPIQDFVAFDEEEGLLEDKTIRGGNSGTASIYLRINDRSYTDKMPIQSGFRIVRSR
jgi:hypothetical protein